MLNGYQADRFVAGPFEIPLTTPIPIIEPVLFPTTDLATNLLPNSWAEPDGIIWDAKFYFNHDEDCNPIQPSVFEGTIQGARNGLRTEWKTGSPGGNIPINYFSAVFSTDHNFNAGSYCFELIVPDDGAVLYIDGEPILSACWGYTAGAVYRQSKTLEQGPHTIRLNYFENFENASFHLAWNPLSSACQSAVNP